MNASKLQYYTMAHRVKGFAEGLQDADEITIRDGGRPRHEATINMLQNCANMLMETWNEYANEHGYQDLKGFTK